MKLQGMTVLDECVLISIAMVISLIQRDHPVGAGLLANPSCQVLRWRMAHRIRQQAGSYRYVLGGALSSAVKTAIKLAVSQG
jgi:hypothetical protein